MNECLQSRIFPEEARGDRTVTSKTDAFAFFGASIMNTLRVPGSRFALLAFLLPAVLLLAMASTGISAATFVPTTFADTPISSAGVVNAAGQITNQGNAITLRSAVIAANAAGGTNSVTLGAGTYQLTIPGTGETAASGDATIGDLDVLAPASGTNTLTVQGAGAGSTTIQQTTGVDRVFDLHPVNVAGSVTFNLNGVTVTGGVSTSSAGAILAGRAGDVTALTNCVFSGTPRRRTAEPSRRVPPTRVTT